MGVDQLSKMLCPPGNGVFTVNTAKEKKQTLHQALFGTTDSKAVEVAYKENLQAFAKSKVAEVALLGVCSDCGGGIQRGANWGPLFIREKLLHGRFADAYTDLGDVRVIPHLLHDKYLNTDTIKACQQALYDQTSSLPVSPLSITELAVEQIFEMSPELKLFSLGGDHSVSYPIVKSYMNNKIRQGKRCGLIHFDAHTDLLQSRLGIDLCFGSWLTHVLDRFAEPSHIVQFGIRSSGKPKEYWQKEFGIQQVWAQDIKAYGIETFCHPVIEYFQSEGIDELYISFDIDALDSEIASATGTPEPDGLTVEDALIAISLFRAAFKITGADLVEVAPMVNPNFTVKEPETTLLAAQRISEALLHAMIN